MHREGRNLYDMDHPLGEPGDHPVPKALSTLPRMQDIAIDDPALLGYPPSLPLEIALREFSVQEICQAYNIDQAGWDKIRTNPVFINDLRARAIELQAEGVSFKMKARLQSVEYLKKLWKIVNDDTLDVDTLVKVDIMKFIIRASGLDGSKDQAAAAAVAGNALSITLNLG